MKVFKVTFKKILLSLFGLKVCVEKAGGRETLCSDREINIGQLMQK